MRKHRVGRGGAGRQQVSAESSAARKVTQRLGAPLDRRQVTTGQRPLSLRLPQQLRQQKPPGKNMQRHIKYTNITRYWVPAAWLSGYHSECPEQQGKGRKGVALPRQSPLSLASTCPSKMRGSETDYPGTGCSPCTGVSGENLKHACACAHQDTFPCCSAERRETVSCRN